MKADLRALRAPTPLVAWLAHAALFAVSGSFGGGVMLPRQLPKRDASPGAAAGEARPKLLRRLPEGLTGALLHLAVSDHRLVVAAELGTGQGLMRSSDAIEEVAQICGLRVHRSHSVARAAVAAVEWDNGRPCRRL